MPDVTDEVFKALGIKRAHGTAAAAIDRGKLEQLLLALNKASKLFDSAPRRHRAGALAALRAVLRFMPGDCKPLALLAHELSNAPPPNTGDILHPFNPGKPPGTSQHGLDARLVACCVYAARKLALKSTKLKKGERENRFYQAARDVAEVCAAHDFPRGFYAGQRAGNVPAFQLFVSRLSEWSKRYPTTKKAGAAVRAFHTLRLENPLGDLNGISHDERREVVLPWLQSQLSASGYQSAWKGFVKFGGSQPGELFPERKRVNFIPDWAPTK